MNDKTFNQISVRSLSPPNSPPVAKHIGTNELINIDNDREKNMDIGWTL